MAKKEEVDKNFINQGVDFSKEAWVELKKVHTPTKQETIQASVVVMLMLFLFAGFLGLVDLFVGRVMQWIIT